MSADKSGVEWGGRTFRELTDDEQRQVTAWAADRISEEIAALDIDLSGVRPRGDLTEGSPVLIDGDVPATYVAGSGDEAYVDVPGRGGYFVFFDRLTVPDCPGYPADEDCLADPLGSCEACDEAQDREEQR